MGRGPQSYLAANERMVANRCASDSLDIKGVEHESLRRMLASFAQGKLISTADINMDEYINTTMNSEMKRWQRGAISAEQLIENLRRKTKFFFRGKAVESLGAENKEFEAEG